MLGLGHNISHIKCTALWSFVDKCKMSTSLLIDWDQSVYISTGFHRAGLITMYSFKKFKRWNLKPLFYAIINLLPKYGPFNHKAMLKIIWFHQPDHMASNPHIDAFYRFLGKIYSPWFFFKLLEENLTNVKKVLAIFVIHVNWYLFHHEYFTKFAKLSQKR